LSSVITGNKVPLYLQVAGALKQRVRTKVYNAGLPLPSVRKLSEEFGVSTFVVQRAVRDLEEKGIVQTHQGKDMVVTGESLCDQAAIFFGFIHPYASSMGFHRDILDYVDEAFSERSNFAVVRSSKDNPALEREIAEHLIANGVKGLIVWPATDNTNGEFFMKLSRKVPVVLVDRMVPGADLPTVVLDYHACGREIAETFFEKLKKKRLLVLRDNLHVSPYHDIVAGIEAGSAEMKRARDFTVVQIPISRFIQNLQKTDFAEIPEFTEFVRRLLIEGGYDGVFCTQDEFIDLVMAQTGLMKTFPEVKLGTIRPRNLSYEQRMAYLRLHCLEWLYSSSGMVAKAADLVQQWVLTRQMPKDIIRLKVKLAET
jgi:DNA-binding LacI/PurR family transcriptional regulator